MRKIKDLLVANEKVWFYLEDDNNLKTHFVNELSSEGFSFSDGSPLTLENVGRIMSVSSSGQITYISLLAWTASFEEGNGSCRVHHYFTKIPKIDFAKYINDADDYLI